MANIVPLLFAIAVLALSLVLLVGGVRVARSNTDEPPIHAIAIASALAGVVLGITLILGIALNRFPGAALLAEVSVYVTFVWLTTLVDVTSRENSTGNDKVAWVVIVTLTHIIGAVLYLLVRRPARRAELGR